MFESNTIANKSLFWARLSSIFTILSFVVAVAIAAGVFVGVQETWNHRKEKSILSSEEFEMLTKPFFEDSSWIAARSEYKKLRNAVEDKRFAQAVLLLTDAIDNMVESEEKGLQLANLYYIRALAQSVSTGDFVAALADFRDAYRIYDSLKLTDKAYTVNCAVGARRIKKLTSAEKGDFSWLSAANENVAYQGTAWQ